jgi:hypothetical protein
METFSVGDFLVTPHLAAPHFATPASAAAYMPQVVAELSSRNSTNREGFNLIRELCLVSYYFFMNGILTSSGVYGGLDDPVSLSMMNFAQGPETMAPGSHAAVFMPRGMSKSRVFTHGRETWKLLREPGLNNVIVNAIFEKALEFLHQVQRNFDSNAALGYFFPEYVPGKQGGQVTDRVLILPNRKAKSALASLKVLGLTGAAEGGHFDDMTMDDLIGLDALDQNKMGSAQMATAKKWFQTNIRALGKGVRSRRLVVATRYAVDDCYEPIYGSIASVHGYAKGDLQPNGGKWRVYYRSVEEDGVFIRPDVMDRESFTELLRDDPWTAYSQYVNAPMKAGLAEFADAAVRRCELVRDEVDGRLWIRRLDPNLLDSDAETEVALDSCNVCVTTDLAATDKDMTSKTCRTAVEVWAKDARENMYLLWSRVGFFGIFESLDYIFEASRTFAGHVVGTIVETNAFQKIMRPWLMREQDSRGLYINPIAVNASGDKKARIRAAFGLSLTRRQVWATDAAAKPLLEELRVFPMSDSRLDTLDAAEKAFVYLSRPQSVEEREEREWEEEKTRYSSRLDCVGY